MYYFAQNRLGKIIMKITDSPIIVFLSALLGAFLTGVAALIWLNDYIDERVKSEVGELVIPEPKSQKMDFSDLGFIVEKTKRIGTGPHQKHGKREELGEKLFCAIAFPNSVKENKICGCNVFPDSEGPNPKWTLEINVDENDPGNCTCEAICINDITKG